MSDQRMTVKDIDALVRQGELGGKDAFIAFQKIRDDSFWRRWGLRALLALALIHIFLGLSLFIAANWNAIGPITKLGAMSTLILLSTFIAYHRQFEGRLALIALLSGQLFIGLWLVVFSQIYQTGADHYQLYLTWALLILPWAFTSNSQISWLLFLALFTLGLWLYGYQHLAINGKAAVSATAGAITLLLTGCLSVSEGLRARGVGWLQAQWGHLLLLTAIIIHAEYIAIRLLIQDDLGGMIRIVIPTIALIYLSILYARSKWTIAPIGLMIAAWGIFISAHGIWLISHLKTDWVVFTLSALLVIAMTALMAWVFKTLQQHWRQA